MEKAKIGSCLRKFWQRNFQAPWKGDRGRQPPDGDEVSYGRKLISIRKLTLKCNFYKKFFTDFIKFHKKISDFFTKFEFFI